MSSYIDTSSINVNFPVSFVNNNAQGFRDNWNAIVQQLNNANSAITTTNANFGLMYQLISTLTNNGSYVHTTTVTESTYSCTTNDGVIVVKFLPCTITLLSGSDLKTGQKVTIKDGVGDSSLYPITIVGGLIDNTTGTTLDTNYGYITMVYDGIKWNII
jgi:hypothetical protein